MTLKYAFLFILICISSIASASAKEGDIILQLQGVCTSNYVKQKGDHTENGETKCPSDITVTAIDGNSQILTFDFKYQESGMMHGATIGATYLDSIDGRTGYKVTTVVTFRDGSGSRLVYHNSPRGTCSIDSTDITRTSYIFCQVLLEDTEFGYGFSIRSSWFQGERKLVSGTCRGVADVANGEYRVKAENRVCIYRSSDKLRNNCESKQDCFVKGTFPVCGNETIGLSAENCTSLNGETICSVTSGKECEIRFKEAFHAFGPDNEPRSTIYNEKDVEKNPITNVSVLLKGSCSASARTRRTILPLECPSTIKITRLVDKGDFFVVDFGYSEKNSEPRGLQFVLDFLEYKGNQIIFSVLGIVTLNKDGSTAYNKAKGTCIQNNRDILKASRLYCEVIPNLKMKRSILRLDFSIRSVEFL